MEGSYQQGHIEELYKISNHTGHSLLNVIDTYSKKQSDYYHRDERRGVPTKMFDQKYSERALHVMKEYATRKLGYKNDIKS